MILQTKNSLAKDALLLSQDPKHEFRKSANDTGAFGNWSYYAVQGRMTWFEAAQACGGGGGHLASVHNRAQDAHLGLISRRDGFSLWIGLSNQNVGLTVRAMLTVLRPTGFCCDPDTK